MRVCYGQQNRCVQPRICKGVKYKGEILRRDIGIFFQYCTTTGNNRFLSKRSRRLSPSFRILAMLSRSNRLIRLPFRKEREREREREFRDKQVYTWQRFFEYRFGKFYATFYDTTGSLSQYDRVSLFIDYFCRIELLSLCLVIEIIYFKLLLTILRKAKRKIFDHRL